MISRGDGSGGGHEERGETHATSYVVWCKALEGVYKEIESKGRGCEAGAGEGGLVAKQVKVEIRSDLPD